jgi:putative DNA primase/helicase
MLFVPGAGSYPSRSELLFAFLTSALRARVSPAVILAGCLDSRYASGGIYQHVEENGGADYIARQIKKAADTAQVNTLPKIVVVQGKIARAADETEDALLKARQPVLVRAGSLVQPLWSRYRTAKGGETQATTLKPLNVSNLQYMMNRHAAIYTRFNPKGEELVIDPPTEVMNMLLRLGHWSFPRCSGVISTPTLRPDGGLLSASGYDEVTGLWHWPDKKLQLPSIAEKPSKEEAQQALELLKSLLVEVTFVDALDRAVALAGLLTPIVRGAFELSPMFLFIAHEAGSGKSFLVDLISVAATGRYCPVITMVSNREEMEKRLGAVLLEGPPIISIDNCTENLEGQLLCQMTERPIVKVRILGKSEQPECEWRGTLYATGNNITYAGDMTRRGLICNLDPEIENPETRIFKLDPIGELTANRGKYVAAALTIARAYFASGERVKCPPLGSYEGWSRFIREPLIWLGEEDPVASMEQARRDDPNRDVLHRLFEQWISLLGTERSYKVTEIIQVAEEKRSLDGMKFDLVNPEFHAVLVERASTPRGNEIDARKLGHWLKSIKGRIIGRHRIVISEESERHGNRWKLETHQGVKGVSGVTTTELSPTKNVAESYGDPTPITPLTPSRTITKSLWFLGEDEEAYKFHDYGKGGKPFRLPKAGIQVEKTAHERVFSVTMPLELWEKTERD